MEVRINKIDKTNLSKWDHLPKNNPQAGEGKYSFKMGAGSTSDGNVVGIVGDAFKMAAESTRGQKVVGIVGDARRQRRQAIFPGGEVLRLLKK